MSICIECGSIEYDPQCETCCDTMNKNKSDAKFLGPKGTEKELHDIAQTQKHSSSTYRFNKKNGSKS